MNNLKSILVVVSMVLYGQFGFSQITGSAHDFSGKTWNSSGEICIVCHTPHNAQSVTGSPLWNHSTTSTTFTLYSTSTLDATVGQPSGTSKLCLSCHDGTVAIDNFGGVTSGTNFVGGTDSLGTSLSDDHPVSFTYDNTLASTDGELYNPATQSSGLGGTIDNDMLYAGKVECASCHDVHNSANITHLLVKSNAASALCLTCHDK
jgi:predicted CXXCH cytochrome family protein